MMCVCDSGWSKFGSYRNPFHTLTDHTGYPSPPLSHVRVTCAVVPEETQSNGLWPAQDTTSCASDEPITTQLGETANHIVL